MVCPVCITTAVVANLPVISTSLGGVVASKVAYKHLMKKNAQLTKNEPILTSQDIKVLPPNEVVSVSKMNKTDMED
jgi:hypothetical protein